MTDNISFDNKTKITWCPGCGNFSLIASLKKALSASGLRPEEIVLVGDIGCSSKITDYVEVNTFTGLHGRAVPLAQGIKLANHDLNVIAVGGDGGLYAEGGNHIIHASRRNINMTLIVNNNQIYGLTKGQTSPTSEKDYISSATPDGVIEKPINPILIALASGASFAARGYAGDIMQLTEIFSQAIAHKGFAIIDVLSPCVSFNKVNTLAYYKERVYKVDEDPAFDKTDLGQAIEKARQFGDKIATGIIYQSNEPSYEEQVSVLSKGTLVGQNAGSIDISPLLV